MSEATRPQRIQRAPSPQAATEARSVAAGAKRDRTMFQQHSDFVTHWHRVLPGGNVLTVWHYLWSIAHRNGDFMFVGKDKIIERTGVEKGNLKRCVKELEKHGLLELQKSKIYGRGIAIGYRIPPRLPMPPTQE